jgi:hypothetical protein
MLPVSLLPIGGGSGVIPDSIGVSVRRMGAVAIGGVGTTAGGVDERFVGFVS